MITLVIILICASIPTNTASDRRTKWKCVRRGVTYRQVVVESRDKPPGSFLGNQYVESLPGVPIEFEIPKGKSQKRQIPETTNLCANHECNGKLSENQNYRLGDWYKADGHPELFCSSKCCNAYLIYNCPWYDDDYQSNCSARQSMLTLNKFNDWAMCSKCRIFNPLRELGSLPKDKSQEVVIDMGAIKRAHKTHYVCRSCVHKNDALQEQVEFPEDDYHDYYNQSGAMSQSQSTMKSEDYDEDAALHNTLKCEGCGERENEYVIQCYDDMGSSGYDQLICGECLEYKSKWYTDYQRYHRDHWWVSDLKGVQDKPMTDLAHNTKKWAP